MTKEQFLEKVEGLADDIRRHTMERAERLLKSGTVDLDGYENNYVLPKNFIVANAMQTQDDYAPIRKGDKKDIKNLYRCIW